MKAVFWILLMLTSAAYGEGNKDIGINHKLKSVDGAEVALTDLKGKFVLVKFWASWCTPCLRDLEHLSEFYLDNLSLPIEIVAVSIDSDPSAAKLVLKENPFPFLTLFDSDQLLVKALNVESLANSYVLNRKGKLIRVVPSRIYQGDQVEELVREHIDP